MRLTRFVLPVVALGLATSACGVSTESIHPGVAAEVGDQSIKLRTVDDATDATCRILQTEPQQLGQGYAGESLRTIVLTQLALRAFTDQLADDSGLDGAEIYRQNADATRDSMTGVPADALDVALPVFVASNYANTVIDDVITAQLGVNVDSQVRQAAAQQILSNWQQDHPIVTNPLFGSISFGAQTDAGSKRSDLSIAVTGIAKNADAASPSPDQVAALPASQRCTP